MLIEPFKAIQYISLMISTLHKVSAVMVHESVFPLILVSDWPKHYPQPVSNFSRYCICLCIALVLLLLHQNISSLWLKIDRTQ